MSDDIIWVRDRISDMYRIDDCDSIQEVQMTIEKVKELIEEGKWRNVYLERRWEYDCHDNYLTFHGERPETETEASKRMKDMQKAIVAAEKAKAAKEKREREEYKRLKKKFEGKK